MAISPLLIYPPLVMLVTIVGWLVTAYFACVKEAITDCIHFDASTKLRKLKTDILPELKRILWGVEGQKFMEAAKEKNSAVYILELRIKDLKSTLHEAEDTLDLLEYHRLKMKLHGSRFRADLVQTFRLLCRFLRLNKRWSYDAVNTTYQTFRLFCSFLRLNKRWSYDAVNTTDQEDDTAVDSFLSTISWSGFIAKWKLKRRIEKMENTIEMHKSSIVSINAETEIINRREHIRSDGRLTVYGRDKERDIIIKKLYDGAAASSSSSRCYSVVGIHGIAGSGKTTLAKYIVNYIEADKHKPFGYIKRIHMSKTFSLNDIYSDILGKENVDQDHQRLQEDLKKKLKGVRFLFVLDDLWENNNHKLDELVNSLNVGAPGSKILVTSRREDIATFLCGIETIAISDLGQQQYFKMFMNYALGDTSVNDQEYIYIGEQIAAKLHRSPLAAALVGGQLRMKRNIRFWSTVAELDVLNETRGVIWWSYQQLDVDIRRCFEYCSIFPRRYELERDELVRMWAAQGFVAATEGMEDIANTYVHELVACSFLQVTRSTATTVYYTMHDLLRDLVEGLGGRDYFRVENDFTGKVPEDVIHLFIETYDGPMLAQQIVKLKRLRTIIINNVRSETPIEVVFKHVFMSLQKLRVLAFRQVKPKGDAMFSTFSFPACISRSKHLRYVVLHTGVGMKIILPSTLSELYHMQLLDFGNCRELEFASGEDTTNLINLRHIKSNATLEFAIAKFTSLLTLPFFYVKDDPAYKLEQLEHLNKLQGRLTIHGLENVKTKADAVLANLAAKTRLNDLELKGDFPQSYSSAEATAQVFDGLCPPESLENLTLWGSNALRCPIWMSEPYFKQLRTLELITCSRETLPENMEHHFTSLVYLRIFGCKNIRSLPNLPRSLTRIEITACDDEFMKSCQQPGHENWKKIQHIPIRDLR